MSTIETSVRGAGMSHVDVGSGNMLRHVRLVADRHVPILTVTLQMSS
jgi:hypothetical protein